MSENTQLLERLKQLLKWKKSKAYMAELLGVSAEEVDELLKELRKEPFTATEAEVANYISELEDRVVECNEEKGTFKSSVVAAFEPKNHEELAKLHNVDLSKYKISTYWTKQRGDKFTSSLLCSLIKGTEFSPEDFADYVKDYKPPTIFYKPSSHQKTHQSTDVLISIADFHLDRQTNRRDTIAQRSIEYLNIVRSLGERAAAQSYVNRFIFVIGNDFFNSDTYQGTTTNGTPQDNSASFAESYEQGFAVLAEAILTLAALAETVDVILVQGNHDRTKGYYLAHALDVFFKDNDNITFDRTHSTTKYTLAGDTFIGFHHGNTKIDELPLLFATGSDSAYPFGVSKYREVLTADKHHYMAKEIKGVRIQQMPSLANPSNWEIDGNFINNVRAGLAIIYHPTKGRLGELEERI